MRKELKKRVGSRGTYTATYLLTGLDKGTQQIDGIKYPLSIQHVLLLDVYDKNGLPCADHVWVRMSKQIKEFISHNQLKPWTRIVFDADVEEYTTTKKKHLTYYWVPVRSVTFHKIRNLRIITENEAPEKEEFSQAD